MNESLKIFRPVISANAILCSYSVIKYFVGKKYFKGCKINNEKLAFNSLRSNAIKMKLRNLKSLGSDSNTTSSVHQKLSLNLASRLAQQVTLLKLVTSGCYTIRNPHDVSTSLVCSILHSTSNHFPSTPEKDIQTTFAIPICRKCSVAMCNYECSSFLGSHRVSYSPL